MNPEMPKTPREELEARLTALLLGELSVQEEFLLREVIARDAELAKVHDRLKKTIEMVRETETEEVNSETVRMSDERRQKLLEHFKTVKPKEFASTRAKRFPLLEIAAVVAITCVLAALFLPALAKSKARTQLRISMASAEYVERRRANEEADPATTVVTVNGKPQAGDGSAFEFGRNADGGIKTPVNVTSIPRKKESIVLPGAVAANRGESLQAPNAHFYNDYVSGHDSPTPGTPAENGRQPEGNKAGSTEVAAANQLRNWSMNQAIDAEQARGWFGGSTTRKPEGEVRDLFREAGTSPGQKLSQLHDQFGDKVAKDDALSLFSDGSSEIPLTIGQGFFLGNEPKSLQPHSWIAGNPVAEAKPAEISPALDSAVALGATLSPAPTKEPVAVGGVTPEDVGGLRFLGEGKNDALKKGYAKAPEVQGGQGGGGGGESREKLVEQFLRSQSGGIGGQISNEELAQFQRQLQTTTAGGRALTETPKQSVEFEAATVNGTATTPLPAQQPARPDIAGKVMVTNSVALPAITGANADNLAAFGRDADKKLGDQPLGNLAYKNEPALQTLTPPAPASASDGAFRNRYGISLPDSAHADTPSTGLPALQPDNTKTVTRAVPARPLNDGTISRGAIAEEPAPALKAKSDTTAEDRKSRGLLSRLKEAFTGKSEPSGQAKIQAAPTSRADAALAHDGSFGRTEKEIAELDRSKGPQDGIDPITQSVNARVTNNVKVQDGRVLFEGGRLNEAEAKLNEALKDDPQSTSARYYLNLISNERFKEAMRDKEVVGNQSIVDVEKSSVTPPDSDRSPTPNSYARSALIHTSKGAQQLSTKLDTIRIDNIDWKGLPLSEVVKILNKEASKRDPLKKGINFIISPNAPIGGEGKQTVDPATGLPSPAVGTAEPVDVGGTSIKLTSPLTDVRLKDVLDAIVSGSDKPLKYSIEDYGVVLSLKDEGKAQANSAEKTPPTPPPVKEDAPAPQVKAPAPIPQPEIQTTENAFSTFSLNVSDVSFKLAGASLEKGQLPDPASIRSEEFINAFDYRDPEPPAGVPVAFAWERSRYPFAHNRDLLRFSVKTAAQGRQADRPLNIVLLLDNSGSMERADRVQIIRQALQVLTGQLQPQDKLSVVTFARTPRLWIDGVAGNQAAQATENLSGLNPEGGTNLEEAMKLGYQTARNHYLVNGINRVVLLTDGAANLGDVDPDTLKQQVEAQRKQGIALDCFGIGWEAYNDDLLEVLSRNGDGRYGFINTPEEAATGFAAQLAGALQVAASDVKVQVEFNPKRVTVFRQIGYAKHQLTKEQFRDNTVDAAEIAAAESGNALYTIEANPSGEGPLATVRVRYKVPGTSDYREHEWAVPYNGNAAALEQGSPAMKLAATGASFSEWLAANPYAGEVTPDRLLGLLSGVPEVYGADARPQKLEWMIRQAKSLTGK